MPISALAGLVFGVAVVSIGLYHATFVAPHFRRVEASLQADEREPGPVTSESLGALRAAASADAARIGERLDALERTIARDLLHVGFVRYNSFSDVGSDQSFTLALLNLAGDGVVVTSIFGREETRTYGKAVRRFVPQQGVSKEEQSAIAMARSGDGVFAAT